jgi:hypothetical protein
LDCWPFGYHGRSIPRKEAEKQTAVTLEAIKAQSDALQRLTGRWMDRLTRYATEPRPADEGLMMLVNTMANLPTTILTHLRVQTTTTPHPSVEPLITEVFDCYIALYHWTAVANVCGQILLPTPDGFDEAIPEHATLKRIVDGSANDFAIMAQALNSERPERLNASRINRLLRDAMEHWRPLVRNTQEALAARAT